MQNPFDSENQKSRHIILSQGKFALVDADDYEQLAKFSWHVCKGKDSILKYAGNSTYDKVTKKRGVMLMHRLIMGHPKDMQIDHINGNGLDNRKCNLRICTVTENLMNIRGGRGLSKYKGVDWENRREKWRARIRFHKKEIYLGCFSSEEDAAKAYNKAALSINSKFSNLNKVL